MVQWLKRMFGRKRKTMQGTDTSRHVPHATGTTEPSMMVVDQSTPVMFGSFPIESLVVPTPAVDTPTPAPEPLMVAPAPVWSPVAYDPPAPSPAYDPPSAPSPSGSDW